VPRMIEQRLERRDGRTDLYCIDRQLAQNYTASTVHIRRQDDNWCERKASLADCVRLESFLRRCAKLGYV